MDSDYTDLYSQYTKMHSNNVELDANNGVLHYQTNDLKPMPLQPDLQTNSIQQNYGGVLMKEDSIPTHNSRDITQDLSLCYDNEMSNVLTQNTPQLVPSEMRPKHEITMDVDTSANANVNRSESSSEQKTGEGYSGDIPADSSKLAAEHSIESKPASPDKIVEKETKAIDNIVRCQRGTANVERTETSPKDVCRVCMDTGVLISIFNEDTVLMMCEKVMSCAAVEVSANDGLPGFICESCAGDLETAYKFKSRCERSDREFREKLGLKKKTIVKTEFVLIDCDNEPVVSDDNKRLKDSDFSDPESEDPSYGSKKKKKKKKEKKITMKLRRKGRKKNLKIVKNESRDSDDDVILVSKKKQKRGSILGKYPCTYCDKTFPYPSVLKLHIVTHTKEKTHKCSICSQAFMYSKDLFSHYKDAHPTEYGKVDSKPYACSSCDKVFSQLKNLKVHEAVHGKEKKYKCEACSQGFTNMTNLNMHKKQDHPGLNKPYRCKICDKRFKQQVSMERHVDNHKQHAVISRAVEEKKPTSTKDLFKSIAPVTTTYWSDSFSD